MVPSPMLANIGELREFPDTFSESPQPLDEGSRERKGEQPSPLGGRADAFPATRPPWNGAGDNDSEMPEIRRFPTKTSHGTEDESTPVGAGPAQFVSWDGDVGGHQYNIETKVDVIAIPCPGADPFETWVRDPLPPEVFDGLIYDRRKSSLSPLQRGILRSTVVHPILPPTVHRAQSNWLRRGIRVAANTARILSYDHGELTAETDLKTLADALLEELHRERLKMRKNGVVARPIFFICHSIGGLVAKLALTSASRDPRYEDIVHDCYGTAFFATPHLGSSYLSSRQFQPAIQQFLNLRDILPRSLTDELRLANPRLLAIHDDFRDLASELQIWTFYETEDSQMGGNEVAHSEPTDVYFSAQITSVKSAVLGVRHEKVYPMQSSHGMCASFGKKNTQTLLLFLEDLGTEIRKSAHTCLVTHSPLYLETKAAVEVHGFYEDSTAVRGVEPTIRPWSTKLPLSEFLSKGPERCLAERYKDGRSPPKEGPFLNASRPLREAVVFAAAQANPLAKLTSLSPGVDVMQSTYDGESPGREPPGWMSRESSSKNALRNPFAGKGEAASFSFNDVVNRPVAQLGSSVKAGMSVQLRPDRAGLPVSSMSARRLSRDDVDRGNKASEKSRAGQHGRSSRPREQSASAASPAKPKLNRWKSDSAIVSERQPTLTRPDSKARKFIWVHLPFTNPPWVKRIFESMSRKDGRNYGEILSYEYWGSRHSHPRQSPSQAAYVRPGCGFISGRPASPRIAPRGTPGPGRTAALTLPPAFTCAFMPFLHFDSYKAFITRRETIRARLGQGRTRPVPCWLAKHAPLELQVIWEFLGHDPPINRSRTLDQFGYPAMLDTSARDDDQILYKMTKDGNAQGVPSSARKAKARADGNAEAEENAESDDELLGPLRPREDIRNGYLLMVDQLWLWTIDTNKVVTCFSRRDNEPTDGPLHQQADLRDNVFNEVNSDLTRRCECAMDLAGLTVLCAVTVLIERSSNPDLDIFHIFNAAIGALTEKMTVALKRFRTHALLDENSDVDELERQKVAVERAEAENRETTSALLELRDLEDELLTLTLLFQTQSKCIKEMRDTYARAEMRDTAGYGRQYLEEALSKVDEYERQVVGMIDRVRNTRDDFARLLEMVQRQAQVDQARLSRQQAVQNRSVLIFTTFTVIFLPLSFFTSLFGMNTREWGGGSFLELSTIGLISLPISTVLIGAALYLAWSAKAAHAFQFLSTKTKSKARKVKTKAREAMVRGEMDAGARDEKPLASQDRPALRSLKSHRGRRGPPCRASRDPWDAVRLESGVESV